MKKHLVSLIAGLAYACSLLAALPAQAAAPPAPAPVSVLAGQTTLSVSNSSSRVALPASTATAVAITILNAGTKDAYFAQGGSSVVATTSSIKLGAGRSITIWASGTYVAAITGGSDTTDLYIYQGNGPIYLGQTSTSEVTPGVDSFATRTGAVIPADGDYTYAQIAEGDAAGRAATGLSIVAGSDNTISGSWVQSATIYTVATLPICNAGAEGTRAAVSDALTPAFLVALVGGGAIHCPAYCDGSSWVAG